MSYTLIFTDSYKKRAKRFAKKHPELAGQYRKVLYLLKENPQYPSLRLHLLKGQLQDVHSVSINMSYRITLELLIIEKEIILINIGSHDDVY
ncbi:plasmid stabilization protein [Crenothrix sp. D3]|nr:plasmid stabilization protein [Crenothrix sp. D3]